jgi:RNA-binding protein 5/10
MPSPSTVPEELEFEFSDLVKLACMLCARQFKTLDQLKKHNKESDLHKVFLFRPRILLLEDINA